MDEFREVGRLKGPICPQQLRFGRIATENRSKRKDHLGRRSDWFFLQDASGGMGGSIADPFAVHDRKGLRRYGAAISAGNRKAGVCTVEFSNEFWQCVAKPWQVDAPQTRLMLVAIILFRAASNVRIVAGTEA